MSVECPFEEGKLYTNNKEVVLVLSVNTNYIEFGLGVAWDCHLLDEECVVQRRYMMAPYWMALE